MEKKCSLRRFWENSQAKGGPEVASIDSSVVVNKDVQKLIMDYELT